MAERFDRGGEVDRFHVILHIEIESSDVIPETSLGKYGVHALIAVIVDTAHEVGRDADLYTVELRGFEQLVQCVGDQMFTTACGCAAAGDLVCDAAHGEGVEQFFQEQVIVNAAKGGPYEAVHRLLGDHEGKVVDLRSAVRFLKFPVVERGDLGHHVADPGVDEFFRGALDDGSIRNDAVCKTRRNGISASVYDQGRAGARKAVARRRGRNADEGQLAQEADVLGGIDDLAAAKSDHRLGVVWQSKCQVDDVVDVDGIQFAVCQHFDTGFPQGSHHFMAKHVDQTVTEVNDDLFERTVSQIDADMLQCVGFYF